MKLLTALLLLIFCTLRIAAADYPTLSIGDTAPDFNLKGTDEKMYTLQSFAAARVLVIIFTCNHCPTAQAYEDRIKKLVADYDSNGVQIVAISPNDPKSVRLDELGYSEYGDTYPEMRLRARDKAFNFPYLYDGDDGATSKKYGPVATPHVFIFDQQRKLQYTGRIDDVESPGGSPKHFDTRNAIEALLAKKPVPVAVTKTFGCSIKWDDKQELVKKGFEEWAMEPVTLNTIDSAGLSTLLQNNTGKLRLINVWATWCAPCIIEMPDLVAINRMYRGRDFELITLCADKPANKAKALNILKIKQVAATNYIFNSADIYALIELVDPNWQGGLPYTLLIAPGGEKIFGKHGGIQPIVIKKKIVDHPIIGRVY